MPKGIAREIGSALRLRSSAFVPSERASEPSRVASDSWLDGQTDEERMDRRTEREGEREREKKSTRRISHVRDPCADFEFFILSQVCLKYHLLFPLTESSISFRFSICIPVFFLSVARDFYKIESRLGNIC